MLGTNARRKVLSEEEIRDVAAGYYGRLESRDYGIEGVDVVEAFIELDRREGCRWCESGCLPLQGSNPEFSHGPKTKANMVDEPRVCASTSQTLVRKFVPGIRRAAFPRTRSSRRVHLSRRAE